MIKHERVERPKHIYPADEWKYVEKRHYPRLMGVTETLFSLSNGYLGIRGGFEEGIPAHQNATFINGFYESWPIVHGEDAHGFAKTGQTIVNVTDSKIIRLFVDDEPFYLPYANLLRFERVLDMRAGTLGREILWETPSGKQVSIRSTRIVSFAHRHLAAISYEVTVLNAEAPIVISSEMRNEDAFEAKTNDPRRPKGFRGRVLQPRLCESDGLRVAMGHQTKSSGMTLACCADHVIETECPLSHEVNCSEDKCKVIFTATAKPGVPIHLVKLMAYHTSRSAPPAELAERGGRTLDRAMSEGFDELLRSQREHLDGFWDRSDVQVRGDSELQQIIRFNLFHICQASARAEGAGIAAKGLTGQGYEGHYFWDTEIYVLPFLIYTEPRIARNLLRFRHSMLDKARARAREVNQRGALFAWRTINGEEASAHYAAGTAQYHINADIAHAIRKYVYVTGDRDFLHRVGVEILVETARLWVDLGFFSERRGGQFCINGVTGPDEYNTVVNNNTFTNLMARKNLWYAADSVEQLREENPERYATLLDRTGLEESEIAQWRRAADSMRIPHDEELGINPQDDSFLDKRPWDFESTPPEKYPLLLHHHPLVIYRHRVIKQADVVLSMFLVGNDFTLEEKRRNFEYYDPLTTGDSSLSSCIQAIGAAEIGQVDKALRYTHDAALMDLADIGGNVEDGCHIASMGGTWMALVYGFAGMRDHEGCLSFHPRLPKEMDGLRFQLTVRGQMLDVDIDKPTHAVTYKLRAGKGLTIAHCGEEVHLVECTPVTLEMRD
jgi:alpha,alpha-trehalose phosphorylase